VQHAAATKQKARKKRKKPTRLRDSLLKLASGMKRKERG
jgi:hypothetical protein